MAKTTVAQRAAHYFGVEAEPRTGVAVGKPGQDYLMVLHNRGGGKALAYYTEEFGRPDGEYVWLSPKQQIKLMEALDA